MNIKELINSTNQVKGRGQSEALKKKFGSIYAYNKTITVSKGGGAIIISMIIGGVTDMIKMGGKRTPVPFHRVAMALNIGEDKRIDCTAEELVKMVREKHADWADVDKIPDSDVLTAVMNAPGSFFPDATVFKTTNAEGYTIIPNQIPEDSEVQVWCSCSDYYWTFQYYNMQQVNKDNRGTLNLYGNKNYPRTYSYRSKAGKESKVPMRNPGRHPGMCKHLMLLLGMLMKDNVVSGSGTNLKKYYKADFAGFIKNNVKTRISAEQYAKYIKEYNKGQKLKNEQRNLIHYSSGNKQESKYNYKTGNFSWANNASKTNWRKRGR